MTQHDYNISNQSGAAARADLNDLFEAIATENSGSTAPTTTFPYMRWRNSSTGVLFQRNAGNSDWVEVVYAPINGFLQGLTVSNNGTNPNTHVDFTSFVVADSTAAVLMALGALTKRLDNDWVAGTNQGMRYSGAAIANTTYHVYAVSKANGLAADLYAHPSTTIATVLSNLQAESGGSDYIYARRVWSLLRVSGAIYQFLNTKNLCLWKTPILDVVSATNTSPTDRTLTLPTGHKFRAHLTASATASAQSLTWVYDPDLGSLSASSSNSNMYNEATTFDVQEIHCYTNTSAQVRTDANGTGAQISISTLGYEDER